MIKKLTDVFYERYSKYPEILQKKDRPYFCLVVKVDSVVYAIPLRHHITHKRSFITIGTCGLDFSKTVIIGDKSCLSDEECFIEQEEFEIIKREEQQIKYKFRQYLRQYIRALENPDNQRSKQFLKYSTLRYFIEI